ncbi:MAG: hypothetical protein IPK13_21500 [Deltaproteobacteria bacterium]|nr:hypothetical protein [Deltaproteobacteria bacterium]
MPRMCRAASTSRGMVPALCTRGEHAPATFSILRTDLNGAARAGDATWRIFALKNPSHALMPSEMPITVAPGRGHAPGSGPSRGAKPRPEGQPTVETAPDDNNASDINDVRAVKRRVRSWQGAELQSSEPRAVKLAPESSPRL